MDANPLRSESGRQIPDADLMRRFHRPHKVILFDDLFRAVESDRQQAAAIGHKRLRQPRHPDERMARHHGHRESRLGTIDDSAVHIFLWRVGNRLEQQIKTAPLFADVQEHGLKLTGLAYIAGNNDRSSELLGGRPNERFDLRVQISNAEFRTGAAKHFSAAKGYAIPVSKADDRTLPAFKRHIILRSALFKGPPVTFSTAIPRATV
jgi:hypothetical protein